MTSRRSLIGSVARTGLGLATYGEVGCALRESEGVGPSAAWPVLDVRRFGASGDERADDWHALAAAEGAVPPTGGVLHFPPGVYRLGGYLHYRSHQVWRFAPGASLLLGKEAVGRLISEGGHVGMLQHAASGVENVCFSGFRLDGNRGRNASTNSGDGLVVHEVRRVLVENAEIHNWSRDGISIGQSQLGATRDVVLSRAVSLRNGSPEVNGGNGIAITGGEAITIASFCARENHQFGVNLETNPSATAGFVRGILVQSGDIDDTRTGPGFKIYTSGEQIMADITVADVRSCRSGTVGFRLADAPRGQCRRVRFIGCEASGSRDEGFLLDGEWILLIRCIATDSGFGSCAATDILVNCPTAVLISCRTKVQPAYSENRVQMGSGTAPQFIEMDTYDGRVDQHPGDSGARTLHRKSHER